MAFIKFTTGVVNNIENTTSVVEDDCVEVFCQCECKSDEHLLKIRYDKELNTLQFIVLLKKGNFFERLWSSVKYIFNYKESYYGHFEDFLLQNEDITLIKKLIEKVEKGNIIKD